MNSTGGTTRYRACGFWQGVGFDISPTLFPRPSLTNLVKKCHTFTRGGGGGGVQRASCPFFCHYHSTSSRPRKKQNDIGFLLEMNHFFLKLSHISHPFCPLCPPPIYCISTLDLKFMATPHLRHIARGTGRSRLSFSIFKTTREVVDRRNYSRDFQFPLRINVKISEHAQNFNVFKPRLVCGRIFNLALRKQRKFSKI